tara:strand:+ start:70 stop:1047 length:978 start_codon:yes stop_codon:yes gene_type:complete
MTAPPSIMAAIYGKAKKKKTSDSLAAFPNGLFIGVPSALRLVAENELGFTPRVYETPPRTLPELTQLLAALAPQASQFDALIVDDASHLCRQSMLVWEDQAPMGRSGKRDRFWPYQQLQRHLMELMGVARHLGVHFIANFHERPPGATMDGVFSPGGPELPSRNQTEALPAWFDICVRAVIDPDNPDPWFKSAYYCDASDAQWVTGDRTGVCGVKTPGNLREILRASNSGYALPRLPGMEWQDTVADEVAARVLAGEDVESLVKDLASEDRFEKVSPLHLRWACQDGIARGVLQAHRTQGLFTFTRTSSGSDGASPPPPPPPSST